MKISGFQFLNSKAELAKVTGIDFTIMPEEEIDAWTNAEIFKSETYQREYESGVNDPRMGALTFRQKCKTCQQNNECPGHFGRIKLERKIYHINFMNIIKQILLCVCHKCGSLRKPLVKEDENKKPLNESEKSKLFKYQQTLLISNPKKRLQELYKMLGKVRQCSSEGCQEKLYTKITIEKYLELWLWKKPESFKSNNNQESQKIQWQAEETYNVLKKIPKQTAMDLLHSKENNKYKHELITHPKDLILSRIFVPPPQVRPFIELSSTLVCQDELTKCYQKIIKLNQDIKQGIANEKENVELIQNIVARIIDNQKPKLPALKIKTKLVKSYTQRLSGKQGRFRQNLMGKRVDFSARTVISPDANLALDELGVPRSIADMLTIPEIVNQQNIQKIKQLWNEGKIKFIMKPNRIKKMYEGFDAITSSSLQNTIEDHINDGVIVERTLQDGDIVLFNRQPTLHKMSMMGHKVHILPYSTFRLNLSVCTPYNADFDGDEMNLHVPQSYETRSEIKHVCYVPRQIITPKSNKPVMGIVQDSLLGVGMFTLRDCFLDIKDLFSLIMWIDNWEGEIPMPTILKPKALWTGKQVISMLIPHKISMIKVGGKNNDDERWFSTKDDSIYIHKGELLQGYMTKAVVGDCPGSLVHLIWLDIGTQATSDFITRVQRIVNNWLIMYGHTISCADIVPSKICQKEIEKIKGQAFKAFENGLDFFQNEKQIEEMGLHKSGKKIFDSFEVYINSVLNKLRNMAEKKCKETISFRLNQFYKMVWAGSKGKLTNLAQVMGFVGQQNIEGARIRNGFQRRTLPHFTKEDIGIHAKGFITSNFYTGLKPFEFFFHTMGGREGLSDTAVKTSRTGYIQRKLIKALEDVLVKYDGTVRDCTGTLIQTCYGEDGCAGEYIESQKIPEIEYSNDNFEKEYRFLKDFENQVYPKLYLEKEYGKILSKEIINELDEKIRHSRQTNTTFSLEKEYKELLEAREQFRKAFYFYTQNNKVQEYNLPVHISRLINVVRVETQQKINQKNNPCLNPIFVYEQVQNLIKRLTENAIKRSFNISSLTLFKSHILLHLSSKKIVIKYRLSLEKFENLLQEIEFKYKQSLCHPGEAIGAISAQSIGEPTTQMTLNTFHFAGVSDRNVTLGVPRLQEILDANKNVKTPECRIFFEEDLSSLEAKQYMRQQIEYSEVQKYIIQTNIQYYKYAQDNIFDEEEDEDGEEQKNNHQYKGLDAWKLILKLDKSKITSEIYDFIYEKIQFQVLQNYPLFTIGKSPFDECELSIQFKKQTEDKRFDGNPYLSLIEVQRLLKNLYISGIKKIEKVYPTEKENHHKFDQKTGKQIKDKEIIFITSGSNLKQILNIEGVNPYLTYTNDIQEIALVLGIEAARKSIINELREVIEPYDIYINYRHLSILADWMTLRGRITPINRIGINRIPNLSTLRKASFEQTVEILNSAAIFGQKDKLSGITENIIFGQICNLGTGCFDLLIDQQKVQDFKLKRDINYIYQFEDQTFSPKQINNYEYLNTPIYPFTPANIANTPGYVQSVYQNMGSFTPSSPQSGYTPYYQPSNTPYYPNNIKYQNQPLYANSSFYNTEEKAQSPVVSPNYTKSAVSPNNSVQMTSFRSMGFSPYESSEGYKGTPSLFNSPAYLNDPNKSQIHQSPNYQPARNQNDNQILNNSFMSNTSQSFGQKNSPQLRTSPVYNVKFQPKAHPVKQEISQINEQDEESEFDSESEED